MKNKKKRFMFVSASILLLIVAIVFIFVLNSFDPQRKLLKENSNTFINTINSLEPHKDYYLANIIPFEWDSMYVFPEYTDKEDVTKVIGFESNSVQMSSSESMQQIIIVKNKEIICYVQDMDYKLGFSIDRKGEDYLAMKIGEKYKVNVNLKDDFKYLEFTPLN
ncbi:hypothetical protein [Paenibacillus illinoisensis]|uniref:hypothetical protein n=1 Tax=Paenibacillus illinoisensis TaxID=59845 RepID=UPI00301C8625